MSLSAEVSAKLKDTLKSNDTVRTAVYRLLLTSLRGKELEKGRVLTEDEDLGVVSSEAKKRREAIAAYRPAGREDLAEREEAELKILESFLPEKMSVEELAAVVKSVVSETGATGRGDFGRAMGIVMSRVKGRADGAEVKKMVEEALPCES